FRQSKVLKLQLDVAVPILKDHQVTFTTRTISGGYAEYALEAHHTVHALPQKTCCGTSGGAGRAAGQMVRAYGLEILGTATTEEGQMIVLQNGAHEMFNHKEANYIDKTKKSVDEKRVDVITEMFANVKLSEDLIFLSQGGPVIVFDRSMTKESSIKGVLRPVIGPQYSLEKAAQAHEGIIHSSGATGKVILLLKSLILPLISCVIKKFLTLVLCTFHLLSLAII
ncbi:hypothetical protein FD754_024274, partial [Muntiacus muntjak]